MGSLGTERRDGVLIVYFAIRELVDEDLTVSVGRELLNQADEAAAYEGKLLLNFQGIQSMSSAMLGKLIILHKRCRDLAVHFKMCNIPPGLLGMFRPPNS